MPQKHSISSVHYIYILCLQICLLENCVTQTLSLQHICHKSFSEQGRVWVVHVRTLSRGQSSASLPLSSHPTVNKASFALCVMLHFSDFCELVRNWLFKMTSKHSAQVLPVALKCWEAVKWLAEGIAGAGEPLLRRPKRDLLAVSSV